MNHLPDQQLIQEYKSTGNLSVLGRLYERYMALVYGVAFKYLKNREDSKDVVMHLFEKLSSELQNHDVRNFKSWLYVMTRNYCLMQIRARKSVGKEELRKELEENMEYSIEPHPMEEDSVEASKKALTDCLKKLLEQQRKCVRLFYLEEMSYRQIVEVSGYDLKKVKSYIQNGKRNLKICLEKHAA